MKVLYIEVDEVKIYLYFVAMVPGTMLYYTVKNQPLILTENAAVPWQIHIQQPGFVDSVTFHAWRNTSGETQSA